MSDSLDCTFRNLETTFNKFGYFPIVSTVSGSIRILGGKVEVITGLALSAIAILRIFQNKDNRTRQIHHGAELALHGGANILRGMVESIPFFGNAGCLIYDDSNRFEYSSLTRNFTSFTIHYIDGLSF